MIIERIGLKKSCKGFSLYEVFGSLERNMLSNEKVADAIFKWEKYAKSMNSSKQLKLTFKVRWLNYCSRIELIIIVFHKLTEKIVLEAIL